MFFQGPPAQRREPTPEPSPAEENEAMYFVDFGNVFAEEVEKVLRYRRQGMMCEIVFWQDECWY